jgi:raffinose/stachyose/melibiose transport system permease protein
MKAPKKHLIFLEFFTVILFLLFLYPFFIVLMNSAKASFEIMQSPMSMPDDWGLIGHNMLSIWGNTNIRYPSSFRASIIITVASLFCITLLSSQAAWVLVRTKTKTSQFLFFIFVAAMVIPFQIVMFPLLTWFRAIHQTIGLRLLRTYSGMVLAYVGFGSSLSVFLYHGFIKTIPFELEEAAKIDGCSRMRTFYVIISPILRPIHATVVVLNGIWIWNDYLLPLLVLGTGNRIQTIPLAVANFAGAYVKQWDMILTAILMAMVPIIIFFLAAQRHIIKGMVAGSIK